MSKDREHEGDIEWLMFDCMRWLTSRKLRLMTPAQRGANINLIAEAWIDKEHRCSVPDDDEALALMVGMSADEWKANKKKVMGPWEKRGKRWWHPILEECLFEIVSKRRKAAMDGKKGATARWGGHSHPISENGHPISEGWPRPSEKIPIQNTDTEPENVRTAEADSEPEAAAVKALLNLGTGKDGRPTTESQAQRLVRDAGDVLAVRTIIADARLKPGLKSPQAWAANEIRKLKETKSQSQSADDDVTECKARWRCLPPDRQNEVWSVLKGTAYASHFNSSDFEKAVRHHRTFRATLMALEKVSAA